MAAGTAHRVADSAAAGVDVHADIDGALRGVSRANSNSVGANIIEPRGTLSVDGPLTRGAAHGGSQVVSCALGGVTGTGEARRTVAKPGCLGDY